MTLIDKIPYQDLQQQVLALNAQPQNFEVLALRIFRLQAAHNPIYRSYIELLQKDPSKIDRIEQIPFLPISFFKTHEVRTGSRPAQVTFESSGTTGSEVSRHYVADKAWYEKIAVLAFEKKYGALKDWHLLALLPSYLERNNASLVAMVAHFMKYSAQTSGFFLNNQAELAEQIIKNEQKKQKTLLIGVSFALLDFAEKLPMPLKHTTLMETGGMKGRRKEMIREDLHLILKKAFHVPNIHSEYGMTELLSQAYATKNGVFEPPPWMRIYLREANDPFEIGQQTGAINIIDLANIESCAFIETQDLGSIQNTPPNTFKVLGRMDYSDVRGCNLMWQ